MKKIITIILSILLCVGAVGGSFALFKHFDKESNIEKPVDDSTGNSEETPNEDNSSGEENEPPVENPPADEIVKQKVSVWQICTEDTEFEAGDKIVIAAQSADFLMGNTQNSSNRSSAKGLKEGEQLAINEFTQIITLENGMVDNTFAFKVDTGYLYAASSSSNVLKTHASIDENSCWKIEIDAGNTAHIEAQGASTKNVLMYNPNNNIFSCYSSTQDAVVVYKLVEIEQEVNEPQLKEGEILIKNPSDFQVGHKYRFYLDKSNPNSEAYIVFNLWDEEDNCHGTYIEPGSLVMMDLPLVKIGISNAFEGVGYIYWGEMRLTVDAEVADNGEYFEILLDESVFSATGDNETIPEIWFELTNETECTWVGCYGGAYIVAVPNTAE